MSTVGIIAEYNPFHTGHAYQIQKAKELTGADQAVVVMSGDFVQRGHAAVMDKYLRTRLALMGGADFVLELPVWIATASAADFAEGGVALLTALGCVDYLCFGSEEGELALLSQAAEMFLEEPPFYRDALKGALSAGKSFPKARRIAWEAVSGISGEFLELPNNILGISYLMAIRRQNSPLKPVTVARMGSFHDNGLQGEYASASAIRNSILQTGHPAVSFPFSPSIHAKGETTEKYSHDIAEASDHKFLALESCIKDSTPVDHTSPGLSSALRPYCTDEAAWHLWNRELFQAYPVTEDVFWPVWKSRLLACADQAELFYDFPRELANRLQKHYFTSSSYEQLADSLKTALYTRSRIDRALLHLFLDIRQEDVDYWKRDGYVQYARVLGFRRDASALFRTLKAACTVPLLTGALPEDQALLAVGSAYSLDIAASNLYESMRGILYPDRPPIHEFRRGIITI